MIKKLKCQRGDMDFPWLTVLIGIPLLISFCGGDDNENKATDTSKKAVLEAKAKAKEIIATAEKKEEKAKAKAKEIIATAKKEFEKAKNEYRETKKVKEKDNFSDTDKYDPYDPFK